MSTTPASSDSKRSARKYDLLISALRRATTEIRTIETEGRSALEEVLLRLLPDITGAFNGEHGFVARRPEPSQDGGDRLELVAVHPPSDQIRTHLASAGVLAALLLDGEPKVIDLLDEETHRQIVGLEIFEATSAILARIQTFRQVYVVGVCNKADPQIGPFLAADRWALASIAEMLAVGVRAGERRQQELEKIQEMLTAISAELELEHLLPMVARSAAEAFDAPAASVMLWEPARRYQVIQAGWGLSDRYMAEQRLSADHLRAHIGESGQRVTVIDSLSETPLGDAELIRAEGLGAAMMAQLLRGQELVGLLSVYGKAGRRFSADERRLARIFADECAIALENARLYAQAREQDQQLARANIVAIMGAWGAEVVHDVHNEVRSIRWALRALRRQDGLNDEALAAIGRIEGSAQALVLPELPEQVPKPYDTHDKVEPTPLDPVVEVEVQRLGASPPLSRKSLRFEAGCPGIRVLMNEQWIRRMVRHLIKNADRAIPDDQIDPRIKVRTEVSGDLARIWVEDNGKGVRPEIEPLLFQEPVPHVDDRAADRAGRGLLLVRYVMEQHGGAARLGWNDPGKGSGFVLEIPVTHE